MNLILVVGFALVAISEAKTRPVLIYPKYENGLHPPGLYGGFLKGDDLRRGVLTCSNHSEGLNVSSLSYDKFSRSLLVLVEEGNSATLAKINMCRSSAERCLTDRDIIMEGHLSRDGSIKIGPTALYKDTVYFILRSCIENTFVVEIRKLQQRSTDCYSPSSMLELGGCSERIVRLLQKETCTSDLDSYSLDHLVVTESEGKLHFLLQVLRNGNDLELVAVSEEESLTSISRKTLDFSLSSDQLNRATMVGGISLYEPDVLCWSEMSNVFCGQWVPGRQLNHKMQILAPKQGSGACGSSAVGEDNLRKFTAGVVVISSNPLEVYYGCYGDASGDGVAGKIISEIASPKVDVLPLSDARGQLSAGSLVLGECPAEVSASPVDGRISLKLFFISIVLLLFH